MRNKTKNKLDEANKLIDEGMMVKKACDKVGVSLTTYHKYKDKDSSKDNKEEKPRKLYQLPFNPVKLSQEESRSFKLSQNSNTDLIEKLKAENATLRKFIKDFL